MRFWGVVFQEFTQAAAQISGFTDQVAGFERLFGHAMGVGGRGGHGDATHGAGDDVLMQEQVVHLCGHVGRDFEVPLQHVAGAVVVRAREEGREGEVFCRRGEGACGEDRGCGQGSEGG